MKIHVSNDGYFTEPVGIILLSLSSLVEMDESIAVPEDDDLYKSLEEDSLIQVCTGVLPLVSYQLTELGKQAVDEALVGYQDWLNELPEPKSRLGDAEYIIGKRWRLGGTYKVNIYTEEANRDDSVPVLQATSPELAARIVADHNASLDHG